MKYLSTNIRFLRQKKGLTQAELAKIVGKTRTLITAWESEEKIITVEDIIKISDYFNVTMDDLVSNDLRICEDIKVNETEVLYNKYKNFLTDGDNKIIETVIEQRIKYLKETNKE